MKKQKSVYDSEWIIRSWFTVIRHGQDGDLGDGTVPSLNSTGTFVKGGQIGIKVTRVTSSTGHFLSGGRDFSKSIGITRHVGHDDQHVPLKLISKVLGGGKSETRGDDTFDGRVGSEVNK